MKLNFRQVEIDLTKMQISHSTIPDDTIHQYLGGRGYNASYFKKRIKHPVSPFSPDNVIAISCGLLTGTGAPSGARMHLNTLSPLTDILGSSNIGGDAGTRLRGNGLFSILIKGRAKSLSVSILKTGMPGSSPRKNFGDLTPGRHRKNWTKIFPYKARLCASGLPGNICAPLPVLCPVTTMLPAVPVSGL